MTKNKGETKLTTLLASMEPRASEEYFDFVTVSVAKDALAASGADALAMFREAEGTTLIVPTGSMPTHKAVGPFACITLTVHSSLDAVGFLARITAELAEAEISVNAVSAYFHDHLFVRVEEKDKTMAILRSLGHGTSP